MILVVRRSSPGEDEGMTEVRYEVPELDGMTVLDAVLWVREHRDPSLAVRFSCRNANACKECVAIVNGRRTYLCTSPACGEVRVEPLSNKPLLRDLATKL